MLKKIGIGLLILILAFFALLFWQKGKIEKNLTALLAKNQLEVKSVALNLLPTALNLTDVRYLYPQNASEFQAKNLNFTLSLWSLLWGEVKLELIQITQGKLWNANQSLILDQIDGTLTAHSLSLSDKDKIIADWNAGRVIQPDFELDISARNAKQAQIQLKTKFSLSKHNVPFSYLNAIVQWQKPLLNQDKWHASLGKGIFSFEQNNYTLMADGFSLNQVVLGTVNANLTPEKINISIDDNVVIDGVIADQQNQQFHVIAQNANLSNWLQAFTLPVLAEGKASTKAQILLLHNQPISANAILRVEQGKIRNLNLLALISQYLSINYDENALAGMDTAFEQMDTELSWANNQLDIRTLNINHQYLDLKGKGSVDLSQNKCDVQTEIAAKKYQFVALPVRFFGNCNSLEYKVEINRSFRQQLKDFIREKLK
ncbi:hypothetical protein ACT2CV_03660 [Pasteurellaceae bacterium 22721_9_1]